MTINSSNSNPFLDNRKKELEVVSTQLRSQRASDIWYAMEQVNHWLQDNLKIRISTLCYWMLCRNFLFSVNEYVVY